MRRWLFQRVNVRQIVLASAGDTPGSVDVRALVGMMFLLKRLKRKLAVQIVFVLACVLCAGIGVARAETAQSPLPPPTGYVNDYANVIDAATKQRLETILDNLKKVGKIETAVVTVNTTGEQDIFNYTLAVARGWGIGEKDGDQAGLILLVAVNDRKYFTQVSRHLEGDLPDGLLGQIQRDKLVPRFKEGRYGQGISDTIEAYVATLAQSRGFSIEGLDQKQSYRDTDQTRKKGAGLSVPKVCLFLLILLVVIFVLSKSGGGGSGCLNMFLLGSLLNSGGGRSSGWGGGGFGGGGGDSGGSSGGFGGFGGGGDFGGGGAGGSW